MLLALGCPASAGTASSSASVSLQVTSGCGVTAPATLNWGTHGSGGAMPGAITGTVTISCSGFLMIYNLGFVGSNDIDATGQTKEMKGAIPANNDVIKYDLSINGTVIGKQDNTNTQRGFSLFGGTTSYTLTATLLSWTGATGGALTPDTYSDVVTARVDF